MRGSKGLLLASGLALPPSPSVPTFFGASNSSGFGASFTIAQPAPGGLAPQAGDVALLAIRQQDNSVITLPAGWTQLFPGVYTKPYVGGEGSVAVTLAASKSWTYSMAVWRNLDPANPIQSSAVSITYNTGQAFEGPSLTPTTANTRLVSILRAQTTASAAATLPTPGYSTRANVSNAACRLVVVDIAGPAVGVPTGVINWATAAAAVDVRVVNLLLNPLPA